MKHFAAVCLLCLGISLVPAARAITLGQIDIFRDGTTNNFTNGNPNPATLPINVGPSALGGLDDKPDITSNFSRADDRLTTFDRAQSPSNYVPAGVTERAAVALALLSAFLLWSVRAFQSLFVAAWNLFRPLNTPGPPFPRI